MKFIVTGALAALALALASCSGTGGSGATQSTGAPPRYQVDPFWPKPLPNQWALGQVAGLHVDGKDHVWIIHRPRTIENLETGAADNPPRANCCRPAPAVIEFDPAGNVVQAWGGPGAGYDWPTNERHLRRSQRRRMDRRQRYQRSSHTQVHTRRKIHTANRQAGQIRRQQQHHTTGPPRVDGTRPGGE